MILARRLAALLVVSLLVPLAGADEKQPDEKKAVDVKVVLTQKDDGEKVGLKKGDVLQVKLENVGSAGYTWVVAKTDDNVLAQQGKPTTEKIKGKGGIGAPVLMVFTFKAVGAGETKLELHNKRPFEKDKAPSKTFTATVYVKAPE